MAQELDLASHVHTAEDWDGQIAVQQGCPACLGEVADYKTRVWYQPTFARRDDMARFEAEGDRGCIGRTLDRISVFPDGRAYVSAGFQRTAEEIDGFIDAFHAALRKGALLHRASAAVG